MNTAQKGMAILKYEISNIQSENFTIDIFGNYYVNYFDISFVKNMWINGKEITPSKTYNLGKIDTFTTPIELEVICYIPDLTGASFYGIFHNVEYLKYVDLSNLDTSPITEMQAAFEDSYIEYIDLHGCNFGNVTDASGAFSRIRYPGTRINLNGCGFGKVTNAMGMFSNSYFRSIGRGKKYDVDITGCYFLKATDISDMFSRCIYLEVANLSGYMISSSNQKLTFRDVELMQNMFAECHSLRVIDFTACDLSNISSWGGFYRTFACGESSDTGDSSLKAIYYNKTLNSSLSDSGNSNVFMGDSIDFSSCYFYCYNSNTKSKISNILPSGVYAASYTPLISNYLYTESYPHEIPQ